MFTFSGYRRKGIAKELRLRVINKAKGYGCGTVQITAVDMGVNKIHKISKGSIMEFEKYKDYLISNWMPEYEAKHSTRDLMVAGWNMLLDEVFSPLIEKELGMHYIGNRFWVDDYCKHRRKVLSLFRQTDLGGSFLWG